MAVVVLNRVIGPPLFRHAILAVGESEGEARRGGAEEGSRCRRAETAREARRDASRRCSTVSPVRATRLAHHAEPLTPPARGRTCACRASPLLCDSHMASKPWFTTCATGEDERRVRERHATYVSFRADAGGRDVSRDRAGRGSSGRTREARRDGVAKKTPLVVESDAGGRGVPPARARSRGESLRVPRQAGRCPGSRGSGAKPGGALASSVVGEGRTFSPTRAPAMTTATYTLERCLRRERWGRDGTKSADEVGRWSKRCVGERHRGGGARPQMSRAAHRPKACTHRHGRPVESLEHDDRAVGLRCQRTPAVGGGEAADSGWEPKPRGGSARFFAQYRVQQ